MLKYVLYRLLTLIPVLLGVSILVFSLFWIVPGDVVDIMTGDNSFGDRSTAEALRKSLNIDKPFYLRYVFWLQNVLQGDFGVSFISGQKVTDAILQRLPVNFEMIAMAMVFIVVIGIPVGILSAYKQFSWFDHLVRVATTLGYSIPNFWAATVVVLLGSVYFKWLPVLNYVPFSESPLGNIRCMLLPGFVLGLSTVAFVTRMARSSALDTLRQDYVRTARAKGASEPVVLFVHVMKNSLIPVVTILGVQIGIMIGGFVLTEEVFVLPGVGSLLLMSIQQRDLIMATGGIMVLAVVNVVVNLLVDIGYTLLDPRIKY
jgi:peptide/nickel transport system permease protein